MFFLLLALTEEERQSISEYVGLYGKDLYNFAYRLAQSRILTLKLMNRQQNLK